MTQIIVVGGTKGGPGKSTVAQQIAACLKIKKKKKVQKRLPFSVILRSAVYYYPICGMFPRLYYGMDWCLHRLL